MTEKEHTYFDHDADVGIIGRGPPVEAAFEAAAEATFGVMVDLATVQPRITFGVAFDDEVGHGGSSDRDNNPDAIAN